MNIPAFTAESSLGPAMQSYHGKPAFGSVGFEGGRKILPQLRVQTESAACYWNCRSNRVDDLTCRFFCGLRPFTIGGLLIAQ
jgi:hypothetical protein